MRMKRRGAKMTGFADNMGVKIKPEDTAIEHHLGKPTEGSMPVIVKLCNIKENG